MLWWHWVVLGLLIGCIELLAPGLHLAFIGLAAIVVGLLVGIGVAEPLWLQWLLFSVIAGSSLLFLRRPLLERLQPTAAVDMSIPWPAKSRSLARICRLEASARWSCAGRSGRHATKGHPRCSVDSDAGSNGSRA